ncbi:MAG: class I SAM-dependent methyltransferase [Planctomycetes bacterium]|nr:class I SAM-dependent methyltransferase [Planctomycetota bacterium]MCH9725661.1 class I SAM-dependent methyltransferase [Planctomycetota bacterium]MCH9777715.1 class I SAM-dependent methyltransferase [Planctomycetota bacterium]MCH9793639.1 class I SAM-dependent methyltransferase [Planctomycetota bacterium]MDF1744168.1 class I SAM-dependent methyltransferase [Gimesia sp.]
MKNPTSRFSDRVDNYIKYRPSYPPQVLEHLKSVCGLTADSLIADIGSGTGILSRMFLDNQNDVYAVEPNAEMRGAAEIFFKDIPHFHSINATAEETHLTADSFDFIIAGQAFHWFDRRLTKTEFQRILKPQGWVVLIWNERKIESTPFLVAYEEMLLEFATDYQEINHTNISPAEFAEFFDPHPIRNYSIPNSQTFDFPALKGRLLSSSYSPHQEDPRYGKIMKRLREIFDVNESKGTVAFEYDTNLFYGHLK